MIDYKKTYWDRLASGSLCLQFCPACNKFIFYPRESCPNCLERGLEWKPVSGHGNIYSYTIVYVSALPEFKEKIPYIYALVELTEGIRMPSNLVDCPLDEVKVGMPVTLTYIKREGKTLPVFKLSKAALSTTPLPFEGSQL